MYSYPYSLHGLQSKVNIVEPDNTFYETVKGVSLISKEVKDLPISDLPQPRTLQLNPQFQIAWRILHAPLINAAFSGVNPAIPYRSIFPGPYIPTLDGQMNIIGDTAFSVFENTLKVIKQRIPDIRKMHKNSVSYTYKSNYRPIVRKIYEPEEAWGYRHIKCPQIEGINFPLPPTYEYEPSDGRKLKKFQQQLLHKCCKFCLNHIGKKKKRTRKDIEDLVGYINISKNLFYDPETLNIVDAFDEVLKYFDGLNLQPVQPALFLFEIEHALSYLSVINSHDVVCFGRYATYWVDILRIPLENLIETELGDIQRVLREIRTFFTLGWSPIIVHFDGENAFNTDGTHRHYALLTIELLRRLKNAHHNKPIRKIDLNAAISFQTIMDFSRRFKKRGLSFRETLRVVNHLVNSDTPWPYLEDFEKQMEKIKHIELSFMPVVYLPEWRARSVVKNLCDKGIALVGVPPENIYIVGRSKGKKGIFIRGGYHGTDRQPMVWLDIVQLQQL